MVIYKISIKRKFHRRKKNVYVLVEDNNLSNLENMLQEKLKEPYFSIVTQDKKMYIYNSFDIESIEVLPLVK